MVDEESTAADATDRVRAANLLELLTPIAKSWPPQWCLHANELAIQVHGGYGYTRDYDVEQHYRDSRLNPIHEGTHGIQSIDLLGRKTTMDGGAALTEPVRTISAAIDRASGGPRGRPGSGAEGLGRQARGGHRHPERGHRPLAAAG